MKRAVLAVVAVILLVGLPVRPAQAEQAPTDEPALPVPVVVPAPEADVLGMITQGTIEQRARMSRFLANKYPTLAADLFDLLISQYPEALGDVTGYVDHLIRTKYTEIPGLILTELEAAPAVQPTIEKLISEKYPELVADVHEMPADASVHVYMAELIQEKYPALLQDVLGVITTKFSALLVGVQNKVLSRHPQILIDVARTVQKKYPGLTNDVLILVLTKYPDLLSGIIAIFTASPPLDSPATAASSAPAVDGTAAPRAFAAPIPDTEVASGAIEPAEEGE